MKVEKYIRFFFITLFFLLPATALFAQTAAGSLRGQVTDPSGAAIPSASVIMTPATGSPVVVQSNGQGLFEFKTLPAGKYSLTVAATGFTLYQNALEIHAVDGSPHMTAEGQSRARARNLTIHARVCDAHVLPFPDNSFDALTLELHR